MNTPTFEVAKTPITRHFTTGAVRGDDRDRGLPSLLPYGALRYVRRCFDSVDQFPLRGLIEVSKVYQSGARKYDARNWEKGIPCSAFVDSAMRHFAKFISGERDEPHCAQVSFNLLGLLQTSLWATKGKLDPDLMDLPNSTHPFNIQEVGIYPIDLGDDVDPIDESMYHLWDFMADGDPVKVVYSVAYSLVACERFYHPPKSTE